ncbi:hypothetical protein CONPUDRAFT_159395 [Coniophora puteana RWD-64-598 SS2]|uniref:Uncharacterized protein n=1 Tax=Coniophora puteana (strain RWD-64-598) TaxID=741705 RepID=A0A5M3M7R2_CONPW|nr:uncharacterized protein CONPUDRAFT_159395 [Coniophora puteana RWD-64-598 SS2]EIW75269.1 hypothetical protein CONPUDRAFT_159395 [Coniophora puteana RWD-64-598 SS2]
MDFSGFDGDMSPFSRRRADDRPLDLAFALRAATSIDYVINGSAEWPVFARLVTSLGPSFSSIMHGLPSFEDFPMVFSWDHSSEFSRFHGRGPTVIHFHVCGGTGQHRALRSSAVAYYFASKYLGPGFSADSLASSNVYGVFITRRCAEYTTGSIICTDEFDDRFDFVSALCASNATLNTRTLGGRHVTINDATINLHPVSLDVAIHRTLCAARRVNLL